MSNKLDNVYAVLLAGGRGRRFWPLSQEDRPKQFLKIFGKDSLLVQTLKRIKNIVPLSHVFIVTNKNQSALLKKQLKNFKFSDKNILFEPKAKNTAPAIGLAALEIKRRNPKAVMIVLPCDHLITDVKNFYKDIIKSVRLARQERLAIFGIRPTRIETGYGYIKSRNYAKIDKFIEKPNEALARKLIKAKNCFWNSGIFVWKADRILKEIKLYKPSLFKLLVQKKWNKIKPVPIDVAVLEKSQNAVMIPAHFTWQDLGSWRTWSELMKKNKRGNYLNGDCKDSGSKNITVFSEDRKVITVGLKDLIIINAKSGLLISHKDKTQDLKKLIG